MNQTLIKEYRKVQASGHGYCVGHYAEGSLSMARTNLQWGVLEECEMVRIRWVPDHEGYDDSYIDTWGLSEKKVKEQKKKLWDNIERNGVKGIVGEYCLNGKWEHGDSIWGIIGEDDCGYLSDIKAETIKALIIALKNRCAKCRRVT